MAYTLDFAIAVGPAKTGIVDFRAQLVDTVGGSVGASVSTGFTEIGSGFYLWHYASVPDGHRGGVKFYQNATPATILAFTSINPEEAENNDVKTSTRLAPTTAGRTLDVTATGEAGLDFNNIGQAGGPTTLSNITVPIVTTAQNLMPAERTAIADAMLDEANGIETGVTPRQAIRGIARTQLSKLSGAGTTNVIIRDLADGKDAIVATVDNVGNRNAVGVDWT